MSVACLLSRIPSGGRYLTRAEAQRLREARPDLRPTTRWLVTRSDPWVGHVYKPARSGGYAGVSCRVSTLSGVA